MKRAATKGPAKGGDARVLRVLELYGWTEADLSRVLSVSSVAVRRWVSGANPPAGLASEVLSALERAGAELTRLGRAQAKRELSFGVGAFLFRSLEEAGRREERRR